MGHKPIIRKLVVDGRHKNETMKIVDWYVSRGFVVVVDEFHYDYYSMWDLTNITDVLYKELLEELRNKGINVHF